MLDSRYRSVSAQYLTSDSTIAMYYTALVPCSVTAGCSLTGNTHRLLPVPCCLWYLQIQAFLHALHLGSLILSTGPAKFPQDRLGIIASPEGCKIHRPVAGLAQS